MINSWTDPDGSAINGFTGYENQSDPPTIVTVLVSGSDDGYFPSIGGSYYSTGTYYPQNPPQWKSSSCTASIENALKSAAGQLIAFFRAKWSQWGNFGKLVMNFIRLYGPVANSAPMAFIEGIMAIGGAPEVTAVLLIIGISLSVYLVWKACSA
jgi:hypothetical protein